MKILTPAIIASSMLCMVFSSFGNQIDSVATGDYNDAATWTGGVIPGPVDYAVLREHTVTLQTDVDQGGIARLNTTRPASHFVMNSGSSLTVTSVLEIHQGGDDYQ